MRFFIYSCVLCLLCACGAWERIPDSTPNANKAFSLPRPEPVATQNAAQAFSWQAQTTDNYQLFDGDDITISVVGRSDLSGEQRVGHDGKVTLPVVGSVSVRHLTREQAAAKINKILSPYYLNIFTTVGVKNYNSNKITVVGRVEHSGELTFNTTPTILSILAQAGVMPATKKEQVLKRCAVIRGDNILWLDLKQLFAGNTQLNITLQRGDVVYVPDGKEAVVYVLGAVNRPGVVALTEQMTFVELLAQAGGIHKDGNSHEVHLIRPAKKVNMAIDMTEFLDPEKNLNVALDEGDIIYVPTHTVGKVGYILQQASQLGTLFGISRVIPIVP